MKNCIKAISAIVLMTFASLAWAGTSNLTSIGYRDCGYLEIDVEGNCYGSVTLYQDGNPVFICDNGGVTYAAPGVYYYGDSGIYVIYGLPAGNFTADMTVTGSNANFSYPGSGNGVSWADGSSQVWASFPGS